MDTQEKFFELIRDFDVAMLCSVTPEERVHCRPMALLDIDDDGMVTLISKRTSAKTEELEQHPDCVLSMQDGSSKFATLSGRARFVANKGELKKYWKKSLDVWFPEGPESPEALLIQVVPERGEYWDSSGLDRATYVYKAAKAYLRSEEPQLSESQHAKVDL